MEPMCNGDAGDSSSLLNDLGREGAEEFRQNAAYRGGSPLALATRHRHAARPLAGNHGPGSATGGRDGRGPRHALCRAAARGDLEMARLLLDRGAQVNGRGFRGRAPLYLACAGSHLPLVRLLLERGAAVDQADEDGRTPLMVSSCPQTADVVLHLLRRGANLALAMASGDSALHVAARRRNPDFVRLLLQHGASVQQENNRGETPLLLAARNCDRDVVDLLVDANSISREDKVAGLELFAASLAPSDMEQVFRYLHRALEERFRDPTDVLPKPSSDPLPGLGDVRESQSVAELEERRGDHAVLLLECLLVRKRVARSSSACLHPSFPEICRHLNSRGHLRELATLLMHGADVLSSDFAFGMLGELLSTLRQGAESGASPAFCDLELILECCTRVMVSGSRDFRGRRFVLFPREVRVVLHFTALGLSTARDRRERQRLDRLTERFVQLHAVFRVLSPGLLHTAALLGRGGSGARGDLAPRLVRHLVRCRADVDARNVWGDTPLHAAAQCGQAGGEATVDAARALLEAGADPDLPNQRGLTALDCAAAAGVRALLASCCPPSLKCLAAGVISRHRGRLDLTLLPDLARAFVRNHAPDVGLENGDEEEMDVE